VQHARNNPHVAGVIDEVMNRAWLWSSCFLPTTLQGRPAERAIRGWAGNGRSLENRLRFHREALDAVRAVWPERLPLTMRLGSDDFNEKGVQFDDAVWAVGELKNHGIDLADLSVGLNTDDIKDAPFNQVAFMVERGNRVRREVGIPVGVSWNLGIPAVADQVIREELIDLVFLGRPALSNPHWPIGAARELSHADPFSLLPEDWSWWLRNRPGSEGSLGWPAQASDPSATSAGASEYPAQGGMIS
jgi:hypothetical protein